VVITRPGCTALTFSRRWQEAAVAAPSLPRELTGFVITGWLDGGIPG